MFNIFKNELLLLILLVNYISLYCFKVVKYPFIVSIKSFNSKIRLVLENIKWNERLEVEAKDGRSLLHFELINYGLNISKLQNTSSVDPSNIARVG